MPDAERACDIALLPNWILAGVVYRNGCHLCRIAIKEIDLVPDHRVTLWRMLAYFVREGSVAPDTLVEMPDGSTMLWPGFAERFAGWLQEASDA